MPLTVSRQALTDVLEHARESRPNECCGLLIGLGDRIVTAVRARNLADTPTRFLIDPKDHIAARKAARQDGQEVLGFYHSHPDSTADPSARDLVEANYPEAIHLIVGLGDINRPEIKWFTFSEGAAEELSVTESSENLRI